MNTELLSIKDAAEVLKLHPAHVSRLCRTGVLPSRKIGACYVIEAGTLTEFAKLDRPGGRPRKESAQ